MTWPIQCPSIRAIVVKDKLEPGISGTRSISPLHGIILTTHQPSCDSFQGHVYSPRVIIPLSPQTTNLLLEFREAGSLLEIDYPLLSEGLWVLILECD